MGQSKLDRFRDIANLLAAIESSKMMVYFTQSPKFSPYLQDIIDATNSLKEEAASLLLEIFNVKSTEREPVRTEQVRMEPHDYSTFIPSEQKGKSQKEISPGVVIQQPPLPSKNNRLIMIGDKAPKVASNEPVVLSPEGKKKENEST